MSGKGSRRRAGANDAAFKAAPWPPESPLLRKLADVAHTQQHDYVSVEPNAERETCGNGATMEPVRGAEDQGTGGHSGTADPATPPICEPTGHDTAR